MSSDTVTGRPSSSRENLYILTLCQKYNGIIFPLPPSNKV
jgi:hypothetical protein